MTTSNVARLRAVGAYEGEWAEGSTFAPASSGFVRTGDARSKLHLAPSDNLTPTSALCGVGVVGSATEQSLDSLIEGELCPKCLRALERAHV